MSLSKVVIKSEYPMGSTRVWVDGVESRNLVDISMTFGIDSPNRLHLVHLAETADISSDATIVTHSERCNHCGFEKEIK